MADVLPLGMDPSQYGGVSPEQLAAWLQLQQAQQAPAPQLAPAGPVPPSMIGGQMPAPQMPDQGPAPASMIGGQMPPPSLPPGLGPVPQMAPDPETTSATQPAPAPRVSGMNPDRTAAPGVPGVPAQPSVSAASTGNPNASNIQPVNSFDPLTGAVTSGNPKPMRAPGEGGPTEGAGRVAAAAGVPQAAGQGGSLLEKFAQGLNNPQVGNLLLNVGIGLMSQRGFGPGIAAGLQNYQTSRQGDLKTQLQQYQLMQQIQGQNAIRSALKAKGVAPEMIEAAALNPAVLSSVMSNLNQKTPEQIMADAQASAMGSRLGGPQLADKVAEADALAEVKDKHRPDDWITVTDPRTKATYLVNKSNLSAPGGAGANDGSVRGNMLPLAPGIDPREEALDKTAQEKLSASYDKAGGAVGTLEAISRQKEALDNGVISGAGADFRQKAMGLAAQYLGIDPSLVSNTQAFQAAASQKAAELAKAVSQAGHTTNMDLQLGKTIAGGDVTKTEQALRSIIDAQETLARQTIEKHNKSVDRFIGEDASDALKRRGNSLRVEMPEVYRYNQGTPNPLADPGARMPTGTPAPLDVGGSRQFQGITIKRVR